MWVIGKYALLQLPGIFGFGVVLLAAVRWLEVSERVALVLLGLWLLKDVVMYRFVRQAYAPGPPGGADALVGARGVVQRAVAPRGTVRVGPELWNAELAPGGEPIPGGAPVRVCAVHGLTLVVEAAPGDAAGPAAHPAGRS